MDKLCISVSEMASRLGIGRASANRLVLSEGFPAFRAKALDGKILVSVKGLEAWIESQAGMPIVESSRRRWTFVG